MEPHVLATATIHPVSATPRRVGRPRGFDRAAALRAAMLVFWKHGYDGASYADLTAATGMSKPTLYASFGDKVSLFRAAVVAYTSASSEAYEAALGLPTAREAVARCLGLSCGIDSKPGEPMVCFLVQGAMTGSADTQMLRDELIVLRREAMAKMQRRFEQAQAEGELPATVDAAVLAEYYIAMATGLSVQAASGSAPAQLQALLTMAMAAWPQV